MLKANVKIQHLAKKLLESEYSKLPIAPITELYPSVTIEDAYTIQLINIEEKLKQGQKITGKKIGLTSLAMQNLLGVDEPDYGHLTDTMVIENGSEIDSSQFIQAKIEAELAFILKKDLSGPNCTIKDVLEATDYIVPALEIVDSRVKDWKIKIEDTVADNASSSKYILGNTAKKVFELDLVHVAMGLYKNGEMINTGVGAAALGNPALCVAWLANKLHDFGISLKAGEVILSGALSAAIDVRPGDEISARFAHLGMVSCSFSN